MLHEQEMAGFFFDQRIREWNPFETTHRGSGLDLPLRAQWRLEHLGFPLLTAMPPRSCWLERQPLSCEIAPSEGQVARSLAASTITAVICRDSRSSSISKEAAHARSAKVLLNSYEDFAVLQAQNAAAAAARLPSAPTHVPIAFQSTYKQAISLSIAISVRWNTNSKSPTGRTVRGLGTCVLGQFN